MCSPVIMQKVRDEMSRRRFLGRVGGAGAVTALGVVALGPRGAAFQGEATPGAVAVATPVGPSPLALCNFTNILDLTHTASPEFPMYPGAQQMVINVIETVEGSGFYKNELIFDEHTGTHMDAPAHFDTDGVTADRLPVERFVAPLAVIDISERAAGDPDTRVMPDDILAWESANGPLPAGAFVAMNSGWETRLSDPSSYINQDASGTQHYPGFHPDAAALLVEERDIVGIGVDTLSLDFGASEDFQTHLTVLRAGKYGIENLASLAQVPVSGATVIVGGPKHTKASGGPSRVYALY